MDWYIGVWRQFAVFTGRARRKEYWMFFLVNLAIVVALDIADAAVGTSTRSGFGVLAGLYGLAVLIPALAVAVRRLHDTDKSGWWVLIGLVPFVGGIILSCCSPWTARPVRTASGQTRRPASAASWPAPGRRAPPPLPAPGARARPARQAPPRAGPPPQATPPRRPPQAPRPAGTQTPRAVTRCATGTRRAGPSTSATTAWPRSTLCDATRRWACRRGAQRLSVRPLKTAHGGN